MKEKKMKKKWYITRSKKYIQNENAKLKVKKNLDYISKRLKKKNNKSIKVKDKKKTLK